MGWFNRLRTAGRRSTPSIKEAEDVSTPSSDETFTVIEGRSFLKDAPYALPKDDEEVNRLDLQYYLLRTARNGIYAAPITQPAQILDVGCGTGRWGQDMARQFPEAKVIGLDLVDNSSTLVNSLMAVNYRFLQGNVLKGLPFPAQTFDFVHQSLLYFALPAISWVDEVKELARVTKRDGWIELLEGEVVFRQGGPACQQIAHWASAMAQLRQIDLKQGASIGSFLQQAGCINIQTKEVVIPIGERGGRLGKLAATDLLAGARALKPAAVSQFQTSEQMFEDVLTAMQREWQEHSCSLIFYTAWGKHA